MLNIFLQAGSSTLKTLLSYLTESYNEKQMQRFSAQNNQLHASLNKKFKLCSLCITLKCRLALQADYAGVFLNGEWRSILNSQYTGVRFTWYLSSGFSGYNSEKTGWDLVNFTYVHCEHHSSEIWKFYTYIRMKKEPFLANYFEGSGWLLCFLNFHVLF